ncbi:trypsin inhibitor-like [Penaeus monodon]|uniref:trypsin inhibitor-like n=1 Tax=Penaeus monodon TaxID=6687 RepID=UPI0018A7734F|nr:trypsin inhibitor-like [Penaeus monodon]
MRWYVVVTLLSMAFVEVMAKELICLLPAKLGSCLSVYPRFHYDFDTDRCLMFTYSGCKGNANNFETIEECQETCM